MPDPDATYVLVTLANISFELTEQSPAVHLREEEAPFRTLSFPIALAEAHAISLVLAGQEPPRPSTHDLFAAALRASSSDVVAARIVDVDRGVLLAELDLMTPGGRKVLDCRPSDAIALAMRQSVPAPILVDERILAATSLQD